MSTERYTLPGLPVVPGYSLRRGGGSACCSTDGSGTTCSPINVHTVDVVLLDHGDNVLDKLGAVARVLDGVREEGRVTPASDGDENFGVFGVSASDEIPEQTV